MTMIEPPKFKLIDKLRPPCSRCGKPLLLTRIEPQEPGFDLRVLCGLRVERNHRGAGLKEFRVRFSRCGAYQDGKCFKALATGIIAPHYWGNSSLTNPELAALRIQRRVLKA